MTDKQQKQKSFDAWRTQMEFLAMLMGVLLGVPLGVFAALRKDGPADHLTRIFAVSGIALPPFWFGLLLQLAFAAWHWPAAD